LSGARLCRERQRTHGLVAALDVRASQRETLRFLRLPEPDWLRSRALARLGSRYKAACRDRPVVVLRAQAVPRPPGLEPAGADHVRRGSRLACRSVEAL